MFTLSDIQAQARALALLPPLGHTDFDSEGLALLASWLAHPPEGMRKGWPASRRWGALGYDKADDSAFYPANLAYLLQSLIPDLSVALATMASQLADCITDQYGLYRSVPGLWSYAFYQTRPTKRWFPFGQRFCHHEHFRPPDDPDDTALIYLTLPHNDEQRHWLRHTKLPQHAGQVAGPVPHTLPVWQSLSAYTTFFSENMPLSFDVGVLANVMNWVLHQPGPFTQQDVDSLQIISDAITKEFFITDAYRIAPYYAHPVGLSYTLARFLAAHPSHPFVQEHAPLLGASLQKLENSARFSGFERLVLQNALLMLGWDVPAPPAFTTKEAADFALYRFPLGAEYRLWLAQKVAPSPWLSVRFSSPSFALGLLLQRHVMGRL